MFKKINIYNILFIDIETVPAFPTYQDMPKDYQLLWDQKADRLKKTDKETPGQIYDKAGIYAEFGKIICISTAYFYDQKLRIKSFFGDEEKKFLEEFSELLRKHFYSNRHLLCAHNGKEFDYPYLSRRMLINGIKLPNILNLAGKKPWEIPHLDTMELWKFGDYKHYTSLDLLATVFNIPTPKNDITGSDISRVYWKDKDMKRIVHYCQKDVVTVAQIFLKYQGEELLPNENILWPK